VVTRGRIDRLRTLPGVSVARGMNDAGDIVGSADELTAVRAFRAFRSGAMQELRVPLERGST
jgi:hypothetical protein